MNIRNASITNEGPTIFLVLEMGHATTPIPAKFEISREAALSLAGSAENAVHRAQAAGLPLFDEALNVALAAQPPLPELLPVLSTLSNQSKDQTTP